MRRTLRLLGVLGVLAVVATSCYTVNAVDHENNDPTTRPWWCMSTGMGGHHMDPAYTGQTKGMLSWQDCKKNSIWFDLAIDYAMQWPTLGDAEDAGFHQLVGYVEGMGTHHAMLNGWEADAGFDPLNPEFPGTALDDQFDPTKPEFLMYGGTSRSSTLVGFAWYFQSDPTTPPAGFAGGNDWWHRHEVLCHRTADWQVVGEDISDGNCAGRGGVNVHLDDFWMAHAWIVDPWTTHGDVFRNHHPCLSASGPITDMHDACWEEARTGGHGEH